MNTLVDVLMVDDESYDLALMEESIPWESLGFRIKASFSCPLKALEYLQSGKSIGLLVSDIQMPIMSGLDLFEYALSENPDLQAVFITGHEEFKYVKKALELSACGYVLKPLDYDELYAALDKAYKTVIYKIRGMQSEKRNTPGIAAVASHDVASLGQSILQYIDERLDQPLTITDIAEHYRYTPSYISAQFKLATGKTLGAYLIDKRIEKATELMTEEKLSIREVCERLGYSSQAYFIHLFKKTKGITPGQYRKRGL